MKKRGLCINDAQDRNKRYDAAEEWSIPVNWEEDPVFKAKQIIRRNQGDLEKKSDIKVLIIMNYFF